MLLHFVMFALACTGQVGYVDLSIIPKPSGPPYPAGHGGARGGIVYNHSGKPVWVPARQPFPLELQLLRITASSERGSSDEAIEVVITNTGTAPVTIPTGTSDGLKAPDMKDRRTLGFRVETQNKPSIVVGGASSKSNGSRPESSTTLGHGECVVVKLPLVVQSLSLGQPRVVSGVPVQIRVVATLDRIVHENDTDYDEQIADEVVSINTLTWVPHPK